MQKFEDSYDAARRERQGQLDAASASLTRAIRTPSGRHDRGAVSDRRRPGTTCRQVTSPHRGSTAGAARPSASPDADADAQPAARSARPAAAARPRAVRARGLRRHRRPGPQEADARRSTTWPTAACCRADFVLLGFARRDWGDGDFEDAGQARRPRSTPAPSGTRTSGRGCPANIKFVPGLVRRRRGLRHAGRDARRAVRSRTASRATPRSTCRSRRRCSRSCSSRWSAPGWPTTTQAGGWRRVVVEKPFGHDLQSALELNQLVDDVFTAAGRVPHRPLPRQGDGPEPAGAALRQPAVRAGLERQLRRLGADHDGRGRRHRRPRRLLRRHRRGPRRAAEPPAAAARAHRDGGAGRVRRRGDPHREAQGAAGDLAARPTSSDYAVRGQYDQGWLAGERAAGLPRRGGRPGGLDDRDLRRGAARRRDPALGRRAVLPAHRQAAAARGSPRSRCCSRRRRTCRSARPTPRSSATTSSSSGCSRTRA